MKSSAANIFRACAALQRPRTDPYLIGVSGGRDSVALLHALHSAGFSNLIVCHLDHALRAESPEEARFAKSMAGHYGYRFASETVDVRSEARKARLSIETAARNLRLRFFAKTAGAFQCSAVFLAHHADDQVETLLFNLLRGAGPGGLCGMASESFQTGSASPLLILRPLMAVWRAEIDAYVGLHNLSFREDSSNQDPCHTRNRIRHLLLPEIEKYFHRSIRQSLWRTAEILRTEEEYWQTLIPTFSRELSASELRALPLALQRRLVRAWLKNLGVPNVGFDEVEKVLSLLLTKTAKVNLPGNYFARRRANKLFVEPPA